MLTKNEVRIEAALRRLGRPTPDLGTEDATAIKSVLAEVLEQLSPPPVPKSEMELLNERVLHIERQCGRCPVALDLEPERYERLRQELLGRAGQIVPGYFKTVMGVYTPAGEVLIIKGRV